MSSNQTRPQPRTDLPVGTLVLCLKHRSHKGVLWKITDEEPVYFYAVGTGEEGYVRRVVPVTAPRIPSYCDESGLEVVP